MVLIQRIGILYLKPASCPLLVPALSVHPTGDLSIPPSSVEIAPSSVIFSFVGFRRRFLALAVHAEDKSRRRTVHCVNPHYSVYLALSLFTSLDLFVSPFAAPERTSSFTNPNITSVFCSCLSLISYAFNLLAKRSCDLCAASGVSRATSRVYKVSLLY